MSAQFHICRGRGVAVVLASGAVISLTAVTGGIGPALAAPVTTTVGPTTVTPVPIHEAPIVPPLPPVVPTRVAAPIVTHEAPAVPTTVAAPIIAPQAPVVTTTAAAPTVTTAIPTSTSTAATTSGSVTTSPRATTIPSSTSATPAAGSTSPSMPSESSASPTATKGSSAPIATPSAAASTSTTAASVAQITPTATPQTLQATPQNIEVAKNSVPGQVNPVPASQADLRDLTSKLTHQVAPPDSAAPSLAAEQTSNVKQFSQKYVDYDEFYRPRIINPFPDPLQVVYIYDGAPRILVIPPLASAIAELAELGAHSFTAMVLNAVGVPINVACGSMFGGGYVPAPGQPPPPPPPPVVTYNDVPVQVKYSTATYQPFVVQRIVDAGMDPAVGEQKVLLDGVTPAWGAWVQGDDGQRLFEVHKTQQFPGLDDQPAEGPLPGGYQMQLASSSEPARSGVSNLVLIGAAGLVVLGGGIVANVLIGRRQPRH